MIINSPMNCQMCRRTNNLRSVPLIRNGKIVAEICKTCYTRFYSIDEILLRTEEGVTSLKMILK